MGALWPVLFFVNGAQAAMCILLPLSGTYLSFTLCRLSIALLVPANFVLVPAELVKSGPGAAHADNACSMYGLAATSACLTAPLLAVVLTALPVNHGCQMAIAGF